MSPIQRRQLLAAAFASAAGASLPAWGSTEYPSKPVRIIVPLQAGGAADVSARTIALSLQKHLKQPVIVENKPGGSFVIGMQTMQSSPADGYTLMAINTGMMAAQTTLKRYDMLKSLQPISQIGVTPTLFVVPAKSRFKSVTELVTFAKANPGKLNFGSVGAGGLEHLWVTLLGLSTGTNFTHIPFKGMPDALTALAQGELDFVPAVMSIALPFVQQNRFRALAVLSNQRTDVLPQVPTLREQGIDVAPMEFWSGFAAPAGTPPAVVERVRQALVDVMAEPDMQKDMKARGSRVVTSARPEQFTSAIEADRTWMSKVVKDADIRVE